MRTEKLPLLIGTMVLSVILSCTPRSSCKENCKTIIINGKVINALTNEPVAGIPLEMEWHRSIGWFNDSRIANFKTKEDGTFNTSASIDPTKFMNDYHILLMLGESSKYITDERNYAASMNSESEVSNFSDLRFTVYPKVSLKVLFKRTQTDDLSSLSVIYHFSNGKNRWALENGVAGKISSSVWVPTCPDVYTIIEVSKVVNSQDITTVDSIKCVKGKENVYTVNY